MTDTDPGDHGTQFFCFFLVFCLGDYAGDKSKFSGKLRNGHRINMAENSFHSCKVARCVTFYPYEETASGIVEIIKRELLLSQ